MRIAFIGFVLLVAAILLGSSMSETRVSASFPDDGAEIFKNNCVRCHGADAKGGEGPDLTDPQRKAKWADSDERIVNKVTNGGRRMPAFGETLSTEEIKEVAKFVRSL